MTENRLPIAHALHMLDRAKELTRKAQRAVDRDSAESLLDDARYHADEAAAAIAFLMDQLYSNPGLVGVEAGDDADPSDTDAVA